MDSVHLQQQEQNLLLVKLIKELRHEANKKNDQLLIKNYQLAAQLNRLERQHECQLALMDSEVQQLMASLELLKVDGTEDKQSLIKNLVMELNQYSTQAQQSTVSGNHIDGSTQTKTELVNFDKITLAMEASIVKEQAINKNLLQSISALQKEHRERENLQQMQISSMQESITSLQNQLQDSEQSNARLRAYVKQMQSQQDAALVINPANGDYDRLRGLQQQLDSQIEINEKFKKILKFNSSCHGDGDKEYRKLLDLYNESLNQIEQLKRQKGLYLVESVPYSGNNDVGSDGEDDHDDVGPVSVRHQEYVRHLAEERDAWKENIRLLEQEVLRLSSLRQDIEYCDQATSTADLQLDINYDICPHCDKKEEILTVQIQSTSFY
ncbi:hypothetical protein MP228_006357 [Amoeboaphelidium protococcarum]|nr:hypothetical protein MP228_006357 [Amoeboaphelidium protococcarum]